MNNCSYSTNENLLHMLFITKQQLDLLVDQNFACSIIFLRETAKLSPFAGFQNCKRCQNFNLITENKFIPFGFGKLN